MNLYHISQTDDNGYQTLDFAVVAAESESKAQATIPQTGDGTEESNRLCVWPAGGNLTVRLIGVACPGTRAGTICASFNAG